MLSAALAALAQFLSGTRLGDAVGIWRGVSWLIDFGLITLLFAMMYKLLPDAEPATAEELQQRRGKPDQPAHDGQGAEHDGKQTTLQETCPR